MSENNETEVEDPRGREILDFDPKQIEEQMIAEAQARAADPSEAASSVYALYVPHFKRLLPSLSTRGLRRVLQYLVLYPLEMESMNGANENEKSFMQLVDSLVEAKFILKMSSFQQNAQAIYDAQNADLTQEQKDEVVATLRAGGVSEEEIDKLVKANQEASNEG